MLSRRAALLIALFVPELSACCYEPSAVEEGKPHAHRHRHAPLVHDHPHVSDLHHRHRH